MLDHTDNEIRAKLEELWPESEWRDQSKIERKNGHIDLTIAKMYDRDGLQLSFAQIDSLAQFFDTKNIETESEFAEDGCESCNFGSSYGFVLRVRNGDPYATGAQP